MFLYMWAIVAFVWAAVVPFLSDPWWVGAIQSVLLVAWVVCLVVKDYRADKKHQEWMKE